MQTVDQYFGGLLAELEADDLRVLRALALHRAESVVRSDEAAERANYTQFWLDLARLVAWELHHRGLAVSLLPALGEEEANPEEELGRAPVLEVFRSLLDLSADERNRLQTALGVLIDHAALDGKSALAEFHHWLRELVDTPVAALLSDDSAGGGE